MGSAASAVGRVRLTPTQRKAMILPEAVKLASKYGYQAGFCYHTSIAMACGCSTATIFNYYNSRSEIIEAVLAWARDPANENTVESKRILMTYKLFRKGYLDKIDQAKEYKKNRGR